MSQILVTGEAKIRDIQGPVVANSGVITALDGDASQYVRGDGTLADFPTSSGGGSSVSYYLNSSVSQGTIGGVAYRQLGKTPIAGTGTDITISANGYVASYITDANDPALLEVPAGNFNCEFYFSVNSNAHNPYVYAEVYKYDGTTFTLIGSSQSVPEYLTNGTTLSPYYFAIPVAQTVLAITDRIAIRIYVNVDGRTVTLHTENNHLCQVVTTFSKGLTTLNNLTRQVQFFGTGTSGTDFNIVSSVATHTFNLPIASATNTGKLSSSDWSTFNNKVPYTGATANVNLGSNDLIAYAVNANILEASVYGTASSPLILRTGTSGFASGLNAISLISSPSSANTLTIISNVSSVSKTAQIGLGSLSATRTFTLPDLSGTLALLEGTQTFTGTNTFSSNIIVSGITIGKGRQAGTGTSNIGIGFAALAANTTGINNLAIGSGTLYNNTTGDNNISLGYNTLEYNTTGGSNIALGLNTLGDNTTGNNNIGIGIQALEKSTTADGNIGIGYGSLALNTTGVYNTAIGYVAGSAITTGSYNTIVGRYNGTATMDNNIVLADGAGNIRYQWNGTNNVFGNPISGTSAVFSGSVNGATFYSATGIFLSTSGQSSSGGGYATINGGNNYLDFRPANGGIFIFQFPYSTARTFTLPDATGTVALTSNLSAYLPLTGGTLTGALSLGTNTLTSGRITLSTNDQSTNRFTITNSGSGGRSYSIVGGLNGANNSSFSIFDETASATRLEIASTGAATFTQSGGSFSIDDNGQIITKQSLDVATAGGRITGQSNRGTLSSIHFEQTTTGANGGYLEFRTSDNGSTTPTPKMRITSGGNVGIGTSSPTFADGMGLHINNNTGAARLHLTNNTTGGAATDGSEFTLAGSDLYIINNESANTLFYNGGSPRMTITSGGNVLMGTTSNNGYKLQINDSGGNLITFNRSAANAAMFMGGVTGATTEFYVQSNGSGGVYLASGGIAWIAASDERLKTDLVPIQDAANKVSSLRSVIGRYKTDAEGTKRAFLIAQDVIKVLPEAVNKNQETGDLGVSYTQVIPLLVAAIKEQQSQIEELKQLILNK
jgi:hypothetical protein